MSQCQVEKKNMGWCWVAKEQISQSSAFGQKRFVCLLLKQKVKHGSAFGQKCQLWVRKNDVSVLVKKRWFGVGLKRKRQVVLGRKKDKLVINLKNELVLGLKREICQCQVKNEKIGYV